MVMGIRGPFGLGLIYTNLVVSPKEVIQSYNFGFVLEESILEVTCEFNYTLHLLETFHFLKDSVHCSTKIVS